jgi:hypothetical protein
MIAFWERVLCSLIEIDQHLRGACCHRQGNDGDSTHH